MSIVCSGDKQFLIRLPSHLLCAAWCFSKTEKCRNFKYLGIFLPISVFVSACGFSLNFSMDHSSDYHPSTEMSVKYHIFFVKWGKKKTQPDKMIAYKNHILILQLCLDFRTIVEIIR